MKKIRVLQVLWDDDFGGVERHVLDLLRNMDKTAFDFELCILHEDGNRITKPVRELNIAVHRLNIRSGYDITGMFRFIRFVRERGYDIVHGQVYPLWIQAAVGLLTNCPVIVRLHGRDVVDRQTVRSLIANRLSRFVTDAYISPSDIHKHRMVDLYRIKPDKIHVLHHGIDLSRFNPPEPENRIAVRKKLGLSEKDFVIGNIGRFTEQKNYPCFIRAAVRIHKEIPESKFHIVGYGELEKDIREQIRVNNAEEYIKLLGRRSDVPEIMGAWDIFMFTTWIESFGLVALEAMATGLPVVASNSSSLPEVLGDAGILVEIDDDEGFAREVVALLKDPERRERTGKKARERAIDCFSMESMVRKMSAIYNMLAGNR